MTAQDAVDVAEGLLREYGIAFDERACERLANVYRPRFNATPGDRHWLLARTLRPVPARWGLRRASRSQPRPLVNVRLDALLRGDHGERVSTVGRCVVIVDGFFEWGGSPRGPWHLSALPPSDLRALPPAPTLLALAAVASRSDEGDATFAIVTTDADAALEGIHDRMPLVVPRQAMPSWLDPTCPLRDTVASLRETGPSPLTRRRVSPRVNSPQHDDAACLADDPQGRLWA